MNRTEPNFQSMRSFAVAGICLSLLLSGCGGQDGSAPVSEAPAAAAVEEYGPGMQRCLGEAGYEVQVMADGGIRGQVHPDQMSVFDEVHKACETEVSGHLVQEASDDQFRTLYTQRLALKDCLTAEGFTISEPPSVQVFIDSGGQWQPYADVATDSSEELARVSATCRQV